MGNHTIAVDKSGNVYTAGFFDGTEIFGADTLKAGNTLDAFIVKYDANGNELWARQSISNTLGDALGVSASVDGSGNVYITGNFQDTVSFGTLTLRCGFSENVLLVKYDPNGNALWAQQSINLLPGGYAAGESVASDALGNTYVTGEFSKTVAFGADTLKESFANTEGVFLVKYDPSGNLLWAKQGTPQNRHSIGTAHSVAIDTADNAYIAGSFTDTLIFGTYRVHVPYQTNDDLFVVKYNTNGNELWAAQGSLHGRNSYLEGNSVSVDGQGNAYIAGDYTDTVSLGAFTFPGIPYHNNVFFAKYNASGNVIWAQQGYPLDNNDWTGYGLSCDTLKQGGGFMVINGIGTAPLKLKFGVDTFNLNSGSHSATVIFQFDSAGNVVCGAVTGEGGEDDGDGIGVDHAGQHVYIGGDLFDTTIFGPDTLVYGSEAPFVARWNPCCIIPVIASPIDTTVCLGSPVNFTTSGASAFYWSPPTGLNITTGPSVIATPAVKTTYNVAGKSPGCIGFTTVTININPLPSVSISPPNDTICTGTSTILNASGAINYVWSPSTGLSCTNCSNPTAKPLSTTPYTVVGANSIGCTDTAKINLVVSNKPVTVLKVHPASDSICSGDSAHLYVSGGARYVWSPGNASSDSIWVKPASNITYSITVSNNGCIVDTTLNVKVSPPINLSITSSNTICYGDSVTLTATGGGTYKWSNNATTNSIRVSPTNNTRYSVTVKNQVCTDSAKTMVTVDVPTLSVYRNDTIKLGDTVHLLATGNGGYQWSPVEFISCSTCADPVASPTITTTYTVTGTDANGCSLDRSIIIDIETPCADFTVPNVFTPNNDGINDDLVINILNASSYSITIYDRWGKQVYTSANINQYWNGRYNGTDNLVPDGTYYYVITASCSGDDYNKKGFLEVLGEK